MMIGISRIRNEEDIIQNTLDHVSEITDAIIIYDDCSTDNTVSICKSHPYVIKVIEGTNWDNTTSGRNKAEGTLRQAAYIEAIKAGANWVYCFDADEYVEFTNVDLSINETYFFRLFDFYITEEDISKNYLSRKYMGPEYRDIPMLFKVNPNILFRQRIPNGIIRPGVFGGYVKHYGKAISIQQWEDSCNYYANIRWNNKNKMLQQRWENRKGKAVHELSDFGRSLITWNDRKNNAKIVRI